jgi:outer membrane protein assembly factor BamB
VLPLKVKGSGEQKRSKLSMKVVTQTASGSDKDKLKLSCVPHRWPSQAYNYKNHNANASETGISSATAGSLSFKWSFKLSGGGSAGITGTPTVGRKHVYVGSWDGFVYALDKKKGKVKWSYDTGSQNSPGSPGIQASITVTPEGRLLLVDGNAVVHALDAKKGNLLWNASIGDPADFTGDSAHGWGSPTVANGRVFVGRSSHGDQPCTQGHLYAFDLDTGAELWRVATVPDAICDNDTNVICATNGDCGGGTCVPGLGGGVTTTPATSADGERVYFVTVGCFTNPSIGNSDSFFSVDAASGAINWITRTQSVEQFADGPPYHDYGFLNGPMLVTVDDGFAGTQDLLIAGSKDGSLYAVDPDTGVSVWTEVVQPAADFAGFGVFNGAIGFDGGNVYAALFDQQFPGTPENLDRLWAFDGTDGAPVWSNREDAYSWADVGLANGVLFVGNEALPASPKMEVFDAGNGALLNTFAGIPDAIAGGPAISDGVVYVPYGIFGDLGGVFAFGLP